MVEKPYHHGDLKNALIDAAVALLKDGDSQSLSLREIAKLAGVSPNAPYRHFEDKEHLLVAVAERGFRTLVGRFRANQGERAYVPLQELAEAYFEFAQEFPAEFDVMFGRAKDCDDPGLHLASGEAFFILVQSIQAEMPPETSQTAAVPNALITWSLIHGFSSLSKQGAFQFIDPGSVPSPADLARATIRSIRLQSASAQD